MALHVSPVTHTTTPNPRINSKDVAETLYGLEGAYSNKDLYRRYVSICEENSRPPASAIAFGRSVGEYPFTPWRTAAARGWHIHTRWIYATS